MSGPAIFYYDFNSPYAYLAAERIDRLIADAQWTPIAFAILLGQLGRLDSMLADLDPAPSRQKSARALRSEVCRPLKPPKAWPLGTWSLTPLRAAVFAEERGRLREFGRRLSDVLRGQLLAGRTRQRPSSRGRGGLEPDAVQEAIARPEIKERLKDNTAEALARGVTGIPTVAIGDELFWGDDRLEEAAAAARR